MSNLNFGQTYDDYNAPDRSGRDRFGNTGYGETDVMVTQKRGVMDPEGMGGYIPPVTLLESLGNLFGENDPYKALSVIDRLLNPSLEQLMKQRDINPDSDRVRDAYLSGNVLSAFNKPVRGNTSVYDPVQNLSLIHI